MRVQYETQISVLEQQAAESKEQFDKEVDDLKSDHVTERERLMSDNHTMAADIELLRQEVQSHKEHMDDLQSQLNDAQSALEEKRIEWDLHRNECPLLNDEIARSLADQKQKEIAKWKMGSQQMDERVSAMLSQEKEMEDEVERLKEENGQKQVGSMGGDC